MSTPPASAVRLLRCALLCGALAIFSGCSAGEALIPSEAGPLAVDGADAATLAVGDCVNAVSGDILAGVDVVPCAEAHDWEVYSVLTVAGPAAGGDPDAVVAAAEEGCGAAFGPFLGLSSNATSDLGYTYLVPPENTGTESVEIVVHCLIGDMTGPVSGSLAGAGR
ncbi:hypothetical protein [Cryobacterium sp.]|jgi:hypothetical protein|uniref:hypothetical protein n=1 Tax=Cryobacterium sp. TaxID=1926290 RepID=UPI0026143696|nr:hypothetical protein [Cryobacterium sp.]MCU1445286.1 hypothetical protein [Cryobacterium sp.]